MNDRPDSQTRILIATILLIVILAWIIGGGGIWAGQPLGVTR